MRQSPVPLVIPAVLISLGIFVDIILIFYALPIWNTSTECLACGFNSTLIDLDGIVIAIIAAFTLILPKRTKTVASSGSSDRDTASPDSTLTNGKSNLQRLLLLSIILLISSVAVSFYSYSSGNGFLFSLIAVDFTVGGMISLILATLEEQQNQFPTVMALRNGKVAIIVGISLLDFSYSDCALISGVNRVMRKGIAFVL